MSFLGPQDASKRLQRLLNDPELFVPASALQRIASLGACVGRGVRFEYRHLILRMRRRQWRFRDGGVMLVDPTRWPEA